MPSHLKLDGNGLEFRFPDHHPDATLSINFQRTLRIPDDGKKYPLPPGLGNFPIRRVDDHKDRVPEKWVRHGGAFLPMYQSEAMWIAFHGQSIHRRGTAYPMAVKVSAGMRSAVTGEERRDGLNQKDYVIIPKQPWLDGFAVGRGVIAQFVAMPLGMGFTAEEQLSGKAEHGGVQIEVFPMKKEAFERRFPIQPEYRSRGVMRSTAMSYGGGRNIWQGLELCSASFDMGLGAGGQMEQQIYEDPYDFEDWDLTNPLKVFVHIANSLAWRAITGQEPPSTPATAAAYTRAGLPWFDHYRDDLQVLEGSPKLAALKTVLQLGFQKGFSPLPENESANPTNIKHLGDAPVAKDEIRQGSW